jgi:uroporphyrinogen-III synthase
MSMINVLSTKSLLPSLTEMAKAQGIVIHEQDAIRVKPILTKEKWDEIFALLERQIDHAIFTSSNAVAALKKYLNDYTNHLPPQWKIFCLSGRTKEALLEEEELFGTIEATANSAESLAQQVIDKGVKEALFFCGDRRREELPTILNEAGVTVHEAVVYEVEETPAAASGEYDAVLFFSPSAVQSFFAANQLSRATICFAIGQTTARSLQQFTSNPLFISKEPTQEALLEELIHYFKNVVKPD